MTTEFAQFEDLDVYEVVDPKTLTVEEKRAALRALNLLQEKRCGKLKGRTVADGRKQRSMYEKSETASPTVANDALMLSIMIDAHERRDIATSDVVGAYLKCKMDDYVLIRFEGESVDILCQMNPSHRQFVTIENGKKVLYARLNKAMYGCVKSALLWYNLLSSSLKEMGFEINPYDPCVANSTINGKQCTIVWYVDDMKISHADPAVVTSVIEKLEAKFGKMKTTRGKEHTFLGMKIKYTDEGTAAITMIDYLQEAIVESGLDVTKTAVTPARKELLEVDESSPVLLKDEHERFHSVVCKLLYVATRARVDILLPVGFLCTRVTKSTLEDQDKLLRVLQYIKGSMDMEYVIGSDDMGNMRTWVDASYAVHPDMRSHTGGVMSLALEEFYANLPNRN
ncbi:Reverse transcriptase (RNA-dependent DNA polymerase) [Fragilaria crotonensis]|nr:Reverse transcriptase (RNA-dependent DNA polymerase) [Fragilaria crotonensis]